MCFCGARVMRKEPRRWTFITASQSSTLILKSMLSRMMPALLTSTVGAPSSAATRSTADCTAASSDTSTPDREAPAARGLDLGDDCSASGLVEVEDGDGIPVGGQALGDGGADAAGGTGDDGGALGGVPGWAGRSCVLLCRGVLAVELLLEPVHAGEPGVGVGGVIGVVVAHLRVRQDEEVVAVEGAPDGVGDLLGRDGGVTGQEGRSGPEPSSIRVWTPCGQIACTTMPRWR